VSGILSGADYVYCWAGGLGFGVRLAAGRVCALVVAGVRADGKEELAALADGHRESAESWSGLLRDGWRRGMRAPVLAVGDGALGFWAALREVFPETRQGRCWVHKLVNVLDCLPKSAQPAARKALAQIRDAEGRAHAEKAVREFAAACGAKYPQAVAKITEDHERLLAFFDLPAGHWVHLKTSNPIESTFSTVRLRTKVTKGPGSRAAGLAMVFKLIEAASERWRYVNGPHLVALVRAGAKFGRGLLAERPDEAGMKVAA
jgi:transposase-like protein